MSELLTALREKSQYLSYDERAYLAQELMESMRLEPSNDVEATWEAALKGHIAAYERGSAELIPAETVFAQASQLTA